MRSARATLIAAVAAAAVAVQGAAAGIVTPATTISGPTPFASCADAVAGVVPNGEVEPWVVVSPTDGAIASAWQQDRFGDPNQGGARGLVAWSSRWNARSWAPFTTCSGGTAANNGNYDRASDVWLSYGPDGVLYQVALQFDWFTGDDAVAVSRSTDDGRTWGTPAVVFRTKHTSFTHGEDKESITADPYHPGVVYVVWDRYSSHKGPVFFSKSTDGGRTWSDATVIYGKDNGTLGSQLFVLPNGTLADFFGNYVLQRDGSYTESLDVIRSRDGGATWSSPTVVSALTPNGAFDPATGAYIRGGDQLFDVALDPSSGALYAVWQDARFEGVDQVAFSRSTDGGLTWSMPVRVSTSTRPEAAYRQAWAPSVDVAPNHTVAITYYDFRNSPAGADLADYWGATSTTGGATWNAATRLTSSSFSIANAPSAGGLMVGDYMGLTHSGSTFVGAFEVVNATTANPTDIQLVEFD